VQRKLFTLEDVSKFGISAFFQELVTDLFGSTDRLDVRIELDLELLMCSREKLTALTRRDRRWQEHTHYA
jgi:hypothetical protein